MIVPILNNISTDVTAKMLSLIRPFEAQWLLKEYGPITLTLKAPKLTQQMDVFCAYYKSQNKQPLFCDGDRIY
jgi:hypothetical protein